MAFFIASVKSSAKFLECVAMSRFHRETLTIAFRFAWTSKQRSLTVSGVFLFLFQCSLTDPAVLNEHLFVKQEPVRDLCFEVQATDSSTCIKSLQST